MLSLEEASQTSLALKDKTLFGNLGKNLLEIPDRGKSPKD